MPYPVEALSGNSQSSCPWHTRQLSNLLWQLDWLHNSTESQCALYASCSKHVHFSPVASHFCYPGTRCCCFLRGFPSQTATWTMTDHLLDINMHTHMHPCVLIHIHHDRPSSVCPSPRYREVWRQKAFFSPSPLVEFSRMSELD